MFYLLSQMTDGAPTVNCSGIGISGSGLHAHSHTCEIG